MVKDNIYIHVTRSSFRTTDHEPPYPGSAVPVNADETHGPFISQGHTDLDNVNDSLEVLRQKVILADLFLSGFIESNVAILEGNSYVVDDNPPFIVSRDTHGWDQIGHNGIVPSLSCNGCRPIILGDNAELSVSSAQCLVPLRDCMLSFALHHHCLESRDNLDCGQGTTKAQPRCCRSNLCIQSRVPLALKSISTKR
jgi:hypothetical protein